MEALFINYDDVLIGKEDKISVDNFYNMESGGMNERRALSCFRYALEGVLGWTPETSIKRFDRYMINVMKLDSIIRFIEFPPEVRRGDPTYILSRIYPQYISLDKQQLAEKIYKEVLSGGEAQFPRDYFIGNEGFSRFCSCLSYLLNRAKSFSSIEEVYEFVLSPAGKELIKDKRLKAPADQFGIDILDATRVLLNEGGNKDADLYYIYYVLKEEFSDI